MLIRSCGTLVVIYCCLSFLPAAEPPPLPPVAPKLIETNLPIKASYPVKLQPAKAQQTEMVIVQLPESVVRELAAKLNEKRSSTVPIGGSSSNDTTPRNLPHGATIIAGIALSLAMVSFVIMPRRRRLLAGVTGAAGLVFVSLVAVNYSQANAPPPELFIPEIQVPRDQCLIVVTPGNGDIEIFTAAQNK